MTEWFEQIAGVTGIEPIASEHLRRWPDAAFAAVLPQIRYVPIADSELQLAAHHLLLGVRQAAFGWEVVADLGDSALRRPVFSPAGDWLPGYRPMALRLLPFVVSSTDQILVLIGENETPQVRTPQQMEAVQKHLMTLYAGRKRLAERAGRLMEEGWITVRGDRNFFGPNSLEELDLSISGENWDTAELLFILQFSRKQTLAARWQFAGEKRAVAARETLDDFQRGLPSFLDWEPSIVFGGN